MSRRSWTSLHVFLSWKWWFCTFHGTVSWLLKREMHCFIIFLVKFGIFMRSLNVSETSRGTAFLRNFMVYERWGFCECPPAGHWASSCLLSQSWESDLLPGAAWALWSSFLSPGSRSFFPHPPGGSTTGSLICGSRFAWWELPLNSPGAPPGHTQHPVWMKNRSAVSWCFLFCPF